MRDSSLVFLGFEVRILGSFDPCKFSSPLQLEPGTWVGSCGVTCFPRGCFRGRAFSFFLSVTSETSTSFKLG